MYIFGRKSGNKVKLRREYPAFIKKIKAFYEKNFFLIMR